MKGLSPTSVISRPLSRMKPNLVEYYPYRHSSSTDEAACKTNLYCERVCAKATTDQTLD